jgi:hypothetical protein
LNLKDIDAVYKKIEEKLDELLKENDYMSAFDLLDIAINRAPSVPAAPLDKLCEWLAERYEPPYTLIDIDKLKAPIDFRQQKEIWLVALTKWMEEQDAAD